MTTFRKHAENRFPGLRAARQPWDAHYAELARYILPRRHRWFLTGNANPARIKYMNAEIYDPTGTLAARNLASGLMSGNTSPTRPWFKFKIKGLESNAAVALWLAESERRMMHVFHDSNFYDSMAIMYFDLVVFGTAPVLIYEDYEDVIRCYNPACGEYLVGASDRGAIDTFAREITLSVGQLAQWFGKENCSQQVRSLFETNSGMNLHQPVLVRHLIEPNKGDLTPKEADVSSAFPVREIYWEAGTSTDAVPGGGPTELIRRGFYDEPFIVPRWDMAAGEDSYGHSPGMDALPDIKQLQHETIRKGQGIDLQLKPPLKGDAQLRNQPSALVPGGITYVHNLAANKGLEPIYQITPSIQELKEDIIEIRARIKETFHNDLFLMISNLATVRSATEIDARREEKLVMLGPALERIHKEGLSKAIDRVFNIMYRGGLLPEPPPEIRDKQIQVEYISMLATLQQASSVSGVERLYALTGAVASGQAAVGMIPDAMDNLDTDFGIRDYGDKLQVDPRHFRDERTKAELRKARVQGAEQQQALTEAGAITEGAKTLSQTETGEGRNALQDIFGLA